MKADILILCTGNSCRSQMAEGILQSLDPSLHVYSAGTKPAARVHPLAVKVMNEIGIDISSEKPKNVEEFLHRPFDYVITVCDHAKETCPVFIGKVQHRLHLGFDDPSDAIGTDEERIAAFRQTRDEIRKRFAEFYRSLGVVEA
jgi:arsenate reductase (thioredoxin)